MARSSQTTFLDTQFVVALVNERDQHHQFATHVSQQYIGKSLLTTDLVMVEIGNSLARHFRPQYAEIVESFHTASNIEIVRLNERLFAEAFALYTTHSDKSWGMTDCVSFVVMREAGIQDALTRDKHYIQAGFKALLRES